jgi:streptogramin lyase
LLAVILVTCGLLGYAAATVHLAPVVPAGAGQLTALPGPPGAAAAADGSLRVASLRDATIIRIDPATG